MTRKNQNSVEFLMTEFMEASQFKAECIKVIDRVVSERERIIITKENVPMVQIVPLEHKEVPAFGKLKGTVHIKCDIISPINENWNTNH